jgi:hypothetical protein
MITAEGCALAGRRGNSVTELQDAIRAREGFRVEFTPLAGRSSEALPPYAFNEMAPQHWKVSDWKRVRLAGYVSDPHRRHPQLLQLAREQLWWRGSPCRRRSDR